MSRKRQPSRKRVRDAEASLLVRSYAVRHTAGSTIPAHAHDWHQLIYASEGVMWVRTEQGDWVVPPSRAVWVPAGVEHGIELGAGVLVQTLYLAARISPRLPRHCCAVNVAPLLRELVIHTVRLGTLDRRVPAQARLIAFLLDQLAVMPTLPLQLPRPRDERARRVADLLEAHPSDPGQIRPTARRAGLSVRTLERLFRRETGLTFGKWRQQLRLIQSLRLLAAGRPVTTVALDVGYDSPSAFIAMFRNALGTTPRKYFAGAEREGA